MQWVQFLGRFLRRVRRGDFPSVEKSRNELLSVFDGFTDPVIVINKNFIIQRVNSATVKALGLHSFGALLEKPCYEMLHGLKERCLQCTAPLTFLSGDKTTRIGFMEMKKEDAFATTYNVTCYPIFNEQGGVDSIMEHYRDSTEIVNLKKELYESEKARIIEPLATGLTHQLRQPLTVIRSSAQYVKDRLSLFLKDTELQETIQLIIENVDGIDTLLMDLLHFAKPSEHNRIERKGSIPELLGEGLRLLHQQTKEKQIAVTKNWPQDLPLVYMNRKLLLQAYLNVLINAIEAMDPGGQLTVGALYEGDRKEPRICITIQDTGRGVTRQMIPQLFQPFFSTKERGVGLGLPIAEEIIRSHSGRILFDSEENKGTTVTIDLLIRHVPQVKQG